MSVLPLGDWLQSWLGYDPRDVMSLLDWLVTPQQKLLGVVRGAVFHDDGAELALTPRQLIWYPDELGRWIVACQWKRIEQEESFVGRAAEVGDELGSRIVASRMVRELMRRWFLLHRGVLAVRQVVRHGIRGARRLRPTRAAPRVVRGAGPRRT